MIRPLIYALALAGLFSCSAELPAGTSLSKEEKLKVKVLQNPFGHLFYAFGDRPEDTLIGLHDCTMFRAVKYRAAVVAWKPLFSPDFYPFFSVCGRQSIKQVGDYVEVYSGETPIGAGGGYAVMMLYRSKDGIAWQKSNDDGTWQDVVIEGEAEALP